ncbi:serine-threonine protein kinase, plant-type, putative [Ricinus communis]|uniref:Serine-threonine protein kinase, plant-type, putative n=1 Tax=Ricinus communis TaxID=3988 RepID=B9SHG1_RICCO|nr:serine-threonine protein kinase, plant-type, putative [Ricinus communis]
MLPQATSLLPDRVLDLPKVDSCLSNLILLASSTDTRNALVTTSTGMALIAEVRLAASKVMALSLSLTNLTQLIYLDLHDNHITGDLPVFNSLSILQVLKLRNNSFKGSIPLELSKLSALRVLDLSSNNLSGNIPSSLGNLSGMSTNYDSSIIFAYNRANISHKSWRTYWEEFTGMHDLEVYWKESWQVLVHLNSLMLSGKVARSVGDLQSLESLDLSHNNFSGEISQTFANLLQLTQLNLKDNKFEGR